MKPQAKASDLFKPYIKYSTDLDSSEPAVALSCRIFYLEKFIEVKKKEGNGKPNYSQEEKMMIAQLMQAIETGTKESGISKEDRVALLEDYCTRLFVSVNKEELSAPQLTKDLAIKFKKTGDFIDLLKSTTDLSADWENKRKYCKAKASAILKAVKDGIDIPRGPPHEVGKKQEEKKGEINAPAMPPPTVQYMGNQYNNDQMKQGQPNANMSNQPNTDPSLPNPPNNIPQTNFVDGQSIYFQPSGPTDNAAQPISPFQNQFIPPPAINEPSLPTVPSNPPPNNPPPIVPPTVPYSSPPANEPNNNIVQPFPNYPPPPPPPQNIPPPAPTHPNVQPKPSPPSPKPSTIPKSQLNANGKLTRGKPAFYSTVTVAQKICEQALAEMKYNCSEKVKELIIKAIVELDKLED